MLKDLVKKNFEEEWGPRGAMGWWSCEEAGTLGREMAAVTDRPQERSYLTRAECYDCGVADWKSLSPVVPPLMQLGPDLTSIRYGK